MADLKHLAEEWATISRRLDEALAIDPGQRDAWLAALPEADSIKDKLRQLLSNPAAIETADFLEAPPKLSLPAAEDGPACAADSAAAGTLIGPYRLLRELGVGGMGVVWLAERVDGGLKRQVALKLPHLSWSRGLAERMSRERDILASLDHPNIARIYEAGADEQGRPYLALEYVEGEPIDAHCRRQALAIPDRLRLLLQVARAVAHAHARLVVHRDLKPANILVTGQGQVRLLDFGIAKLMEGELTRETQLTRQVGRVLTLDYASPEQIRGDPIGTASDVYSLGVVAYELLAQAKPYQLQRQSAAALEEAIGTVDARLASSAATSPGARRALQGDLDAILNKALKKDVAERYPTIDAFAQDIERHLANLPVQARPDALGYRARKFLRRNKLAVVASAAVSVSLIAGLSVAIWQAREALAQAERAEQVKAFVLSIFDDADTDSGAGVATTAADLLKSAQRRVSDELSGRPEVAVELMTALGYSLLGQGLTSDAASLMRDAVDLSRRQLGLQHALTRAAQVVYGEALVGLGSNKEAISVLSPAVESARLVGDQRSLNAGLRWLSSAQLNEGQIDAAIESARLSVATLSARGRIGKPQGPRDAVFAHSAYANALNFAQRPGVADAARLALASAHEVYGQKVTQATLNIRTLLALGLVGESRLEEGLREIDALIPSAVELLGPSHPSVAKIASLVGTTRLAAGDVPGAIVALRYSMEVEDRRGGSGLHFDRGMVRFVLAGAHATAHQPAQALALLDEAVNLLKSGAGPDNPLTLRAASLRALQLAESGRLNDAEVEFKALESARWPGPHLAVHQGRLAVLRSLQGRHADALRLAESASETLQKVPNKYVQARTLTLLGTIRLEAGDARAALQPLQEARGLFTQVQIGISPEHADTLVALGRTQLKLGDASAAVQALSAANQFWQAFDPANRHAGQARLYLAQAVRAQGGKPGGTN